MRALSSALQTVLAKGGPFVIADLYTITLADGTVLRWTSAQQPLTVGASTYSVGPPIQRDKVSWKTGLNVDQIHVTIEDDGSATIGGQPLVAAAWKNLLDLAQVEIDLFISDSWSNTSVGSVNLFIGTVGEVSVSGKSIDLTVESPLAQLNATFPRSYILPTCANTLYDSICGLAAANFTFGGTVGANPSATSFPISGISKPDGYFALGKIRFTSGPNAGQARSIKSYVGGVVTLAYPLYTLPAQGDAVSLTAGCDKTRATCSGRFNNLAHFRGFPCVPDPSLQYQGTNNGNTTGPGVSGEVNRDRIPGGGRGPGGRGGGRVQFN
ncbi:MAG: DUF2163 domain-containing protein [Sinobacteraceae bacterium]|nr:DUF2163 domain-containing protein [Nevskiaceae bacterium]